jgi:uncharacterized protein YjgD (DUF1641 family)
MHPFLIELSRRFDRLQQRDEILDTIGELDKIYDTLSEIEQETVSKLLEALNRRLESESRDRYPSRGY